MGFTLKIVHVGKTGDLWQGPCNRYCRLLKPLVSCKLVDVKSEGGPAIGPHQCRKREGERLVAQCASGSYPVALSETGARRDSLQFSAWLGKRREQGGELVLLIGGAYGLDERVLERCRETISLSPLTFAHELCLVVVLEQVYRAFTILNNHPYHK